ncbi:MAG TPA: ABC transporter permease [Bryobacteraceae bacterium]|jgi:putative ABC transport system permease protein
MHIRATFESVPRNLRLALRTLAKTPVFTATVVLTLALGIGANSAVFSALDAILLRPLPYPEAGQLVDLLHHNPRTPETLIAPVRLTDWNRLNSAFQSISGYYSEDDSETSGLLPEKLTHAMVAPRFLETLGISPALGRDFSPQEEHWGGPDATLISNRLWRRRFSADPAVLGKILHIGRNSYAIVGVLPPSFAFPSRDVDLWSPNAMDAPFAQGRQLTWFNGFGRLKPGVTVEQGRANLAAIQTALGQQFGKPDSELTVEVQPLKDKIVGGVSSSLWILFGSVTLLLLIACTNVVALLLSRAEQRRQEISVRLSLGASRASLVNQLLTETFVLAFAGAAAGLAVAASAARVFRALAANLPRVDEVHLDARIVLYSLTCAVAVTLLSGLLPALRGTRSSLSRALTQASRTQVSSRHRLPWLLVGVQVALAVTLLAGAGLLLRSLQELGRVNPGFDVDHVLTFQISASWGETGDMRTLAQRAQRTLDFLGTIPGVATSALSIGVPAAVSARPQSEIKLVEGRAESEGKIIAGGRAVSPGYFAAMQIPLLAGNLCRTDANTSDVMVNRSFTHAYFTGAGPIGLHLPPPYPGAQPSEIRGIVGDAREQGLHRAPAPTVYLCTLAAQPGTVFLVRTHADPAALSETIRRKLHEIEPARSVYDIRPLREHLTEAFSENRLRTILLTFFALTALALACVGLYGTLSYLVNVRRREVGLRLALGALRGSIVLQFLRQGILVAFLGCVAGLALAAASTRLLKSMLYGVSTSDLFTLSSVIALVLAVAASASLIPAARAARVDPMQALRDE